MKDYKEILKKMNTTYLLYAKEAIDYALKCIDTKEKVLDNPEKWIKWCDERILEENESLRKIVENLPSQEKNNKGTLGYEYEILENRNNTLKILLILIGYNNDKYTKTFYIDTKYYSGNNFYDCLFNNVIQAKAPITKPKEG